jgi:hypothetical protein
VQSLYLNLLGRQGSVAEVSSWLSFLNSSQAGMSAVAQAFVGSAEFRGHQVQAFYGVAPVGVISAADLLRRPSLPSAAEVALFTDLNLDLLSIESLILSSGEFAANG